MIDYTIRAFDTDLQELAGKIAEMGRLDREQIADAIDALVKGDTPASPSVSWQRMIGSMRCSMRSRKRPWLPLPDGSR